jgi:hypothetical protein
MGRVCSYVPIVAEPECLPPSMASRARASLCSSFSCPPSLSSLRTISRPGVPPGTMNRAWPRCPSSPPRPLQHLLGRGGLADRGEGERGHHDRQSDSGAAPEQLLHEHRQRQAGGVADQVAVEERAVENTLGGLLEHRPGKLLAHVLVCSHRPHYFFGELVGAPSPGRTFPSTALSLVLR